MVVIFIMRLGTCEDHEYPALGKNQLPVKEA
jgi:hypothetical protein